MEAAVQNEDVSVQDYLAAEEQGEVRHEYLGGRVYSMAGETRDHNTLALNLAVPIRQHLKGGPCQLYLHNIRVNFSLRQDEYYYYPDLVVTCDPRDSDPHFVCQPRLIIEVMSPTTERIDRREKFFAYTSLESLEEYVLVAQPAQEVTVFRRANGWAAQRVSGRTTAVVFESLHLSLPLAAMYEGI